MNLYSNPEDLRIYAIVEVRKRGKMGIVMTGTNRNQMKGAFNRMRAVRTVRQTQLSFLVFAVFTASERATSKPAGEPQP